MYVALAQRRDVRKAQLEQQYTQVCLLTRFPPFKLLIHLVNCSISVDHSAWRSLMG